MYQSPDPRHNTALAEVYVGLSVCYHTNIINYNSNSQEENLTTLWYFYNNIIYLLLKAAINNTLY